MSCNSSSAPISPRSLRIDETAVATGMRAQNAALVRSTTPMRTSIVWIRRSESSERTVRPMMGWALVSGREGALSPCHIAPGGGSMSRAVVQ